MCVGYCWGGWSQLVLLHRVSVQRASPVIAGGGISLVLAKLHKTPQVQGTGSITLSACLMLHPYFQHRLPCAWAAYLLPLLPLRETYLDLGGHHMHLDFARSTSSADVCEEEDLRGRKGRFGAQVGSWPKEGPCKRAVSNSAVEL